MENYRVNSKSGVKFSSRLKAKSRKNRVKRDLPVPDITGPPISLNT